MALTGYEIQAGNLLYFTYDSALNSGAGGFHVVITFTNAIVGTERGLTGSAPGGTKNATWTVKEVIAEVAIGGAAVKGSGLSLFFYGATVGAGGMDAGTIPVSGSLAVYAIYSPALNSWSTLGYASGAAAPAPVYPGSNAPAGYAFSVLLWTGLTDSSGNIIHFQQFDRSVFSGPTSVVSATAATANTYATASVSAAVPYGALTAWGTAGSTSTAAAAQVAVASDTSGSFVQQVVAGFSAVALDGYGTAGSFGPIPLTTPQQIAWKAGTNTVNTTIKLVGYTF